MEKTQRYIVIDVETPNHRNDRITSLGVAVVENGQITNTTEYLINPESTFDPVNSSLTGITRESVANSPTFPAVWERIAPLLPGSILVTHNAKFDLSVLNKTLAAYHIPADKTQYICTYQAAKDSFPDMGHYRLDDVCAMLEIPLDHHHAGSDAAACAQILLALLRSGHALPCKLYQFGAVCQTPETPVHRHLSQHSQELNELLDLLDMVSADNVLTEDEAMLVSQWMMDHRELAGEYPYDRFFAAMNTALEDGILESVELNKLLSLCKKLADPVGCTECACSIDLSGKQEG